MSEETQNISRLVREAPESAARVEKFAGDGASVLRQTLTSKQILRTYQRRSLRSFATLRLCVKLFSRRGAEPQSIAKKHETGN